MTEAVTGTNKANDMAAQQLDTLQGQWAELTSQLEEVAIMFGDVLIPIIRQLITKYVMPLTTKLMGMSVSTRKNVVVIALLAAAIGPLLLVIGKLISSIGTMTKVASFLFSKAGLIIAAIAVVVGAVLYLWNTNEEFRGAVTKIWNKVQKAILKAVDKIKAWWDKNGAKIIAEAKEALLALWGVVSHVFSRILEIVVQVFGAVKNIVQEVLGYILQFWNQYGARIWETVKNLFTQIWNIVKTCFDIIVDAVLKFLTYVQPIWENIKSLFASLWDTIVQLYETLKPIFELIGGVVLTLLGVVTGVIDGILSALGPLIQAVIDVGKAVLDIVKMVCAVLRGDWAEAWEYMQSFATNIWSGIKNIFLGIWEFIQGFCDGIGKFFSNLGVDITAIFKSCWEGISGFFSNIWDGICSVCGWIWDKITGLFSSIGDYFTNLFKEAFNWGKNLIQNIGDGIESAWNWVVDGVKSVGGSIADFLGFGSPTKKGPGHTADEWIPNLMDMMAAGMYADIPLIQRAAIQVAAALNPTNTTNRAVVGTGNSPYGEILNGLLQGMTATNGMASEEQQELVMQIDGQAFARLIVPKLTREYKRNGVILKEV